MKQLLVLTSILLITGPVFANPANFNHNLSSAWKNQQSMHAQLDNRDIAMVYGGKDISLKPSFVPSTTVV